MSIQPLKSPRLHQRIAQEIEQLIAAGSFPPGTRLPAERQLAQSLRVSRSSLREALSALELQGVLEIKVGSGAWVRKPPEGAAQAPAPAAFPAGIPPFDLLHARRIVEPEAAALAARQATPAQRVEIAQAFARLEREMADNAPLPQADRDFHVRIARASGNAALALIVERLWLEFHSPLGQRMEALYVTPDRRRDNIEEHRAVLQAVVGGDAARARQAMRRHLLNAERQRLTDLQHREMPSEPETYDARRRSTR